MHQLSLGSSAELIAPTSQAHSPQRRTALQHPPQAIPTAIAPAARSPQRPIDLQPEAPPDRSISAPLRIAPAAQLGFNPLKHCRLCGADIKIPGLDHSLCSGDCGCVIDLVWLAAHSRQPKEPEPQAATHSTEAVQTLDLLARSASEGGAA